MFHKHERWHDNKTILAGEKLLYYELDEIFIITPEICKGIHYSTYLMNILE